MSLTATLYNTTALVGNPVKVVIASSSQATYKIKQGSTIVYTGVVEAGTTTFHIGDILSSLVSGTLYEDVTDILLQNSSNVANYSIEVTNTEGNTAISVNGTAVAGAISKRALRTLLNTGSNIFTFKLLNGAGNFFMSTRSSSKVLNIRETELVPLVFIAPTTAIILTAGVNAYTMSGLVVGKCYALNIEALRRYFWNTHKQLANQFVVSTEEGTSVTIQILESLEVNAHFYIDFLNSFSCYERIEVRGSGTLTQESSSDDDNYSQYDEDVNDYVERRNRQRSQDTLTVSTGFRTEEEFLFLIDILSSDEAFLIGYEDRRIRVNVTTEDYTLYKNLGKTQRMDLKLKFADEEQFFTQALSSADFDDPRIHSEQFSAQFN